MTAQMLELALIPKAPIFLSLRKASHRLGEPQSLYPRHPEQKSPDYLRRAIFPGGILRLGDTFRRDRARTDTQPDLKRAAEGSRRGRGPGNRIGGKPRDLDQACDNAQINYLRAARYIPIRGITAYFISAGEGGRACQRAGHPHRARRFDMRGEDNRKAED
jgi:hypothetical protein